jgi:hypothetical protein
VIRVKTHKREMSLWFAGFRNLLPSALTQNLRVPSGTYTFMSLDPNADSTPRLVSFHEDLAPSPRAAERPLSIIERIAAQTLGDRLQVGVAQAAGHVRSRVMTWSRRAVINVIGAMGASPGSEPKTRLMSAAMIALLCFFLTLLASPLKSKRRQRTRCSDVS